MHYPPGGALGFLVSFAHSAWSSSDVIARDSIKAKEVAVVTRLGRAPSGREGHVAVEELAGIRWWNGATLPVGLLVNFFDVGWGGKPWRRQPLPLNMVDPVVVNP